MEKNENKKFVMTVSKKHEIFQYLDTMENNDEKLSFLKSIENLYETNVHLDEDDLWDRYEFNLTQSSIIKVQVIFNDDLSIQSEEMVKLFPYQNLINHELTDKINENICGECIVLNVNMNQLIELNNLQLNLIVLGCTDENGDEIYMEDSDGISYELGEEMWEDFSWYFTTYFIDPLILLYSSKQLENQTTT